MRSVKLSEETYIRLLKRAETFEDTPEVVIQRLLDAVGVPDSSEEASGTFTWQPPTRVSTARAAPGSILAEREYWPAVLTAIVERGGTAPTNDVIERVGELLESRLTEKDRDHLESGELRWRNRTRFARQRMKEQGLLSVNSPRGMWEITRAGQEYLRANLLKR